jgi:hypothetical protein
MNISSNMRFLTITMLAVVCLLPTALRADSSSPGEPSQNPGAINVGQWKLLGKGNLTDVLAEKLPYRQENTHYFFVHVQVRNKQDRPIGLSLSGRGIAPFSWRVARQENEPVFVYDGPTEPPVPVLTEKQRNELCAAFKANKLVLIERGKSLDYYVCFNASDWSDVEAQLRENKCSCVIVTMNGGVYASNGEVSEVIGGSSDCAFAAPLKWQKIPVDSKMLADF